MQGEGFPHPHRLQHHPVASPLVPSTHHAQLESLGAVLGNPQHLLGFGKNLRRDNGATGKEKRGEFLRLSEFMSVWMSRKQERKARRVVAATLQFPNPCSPPLWSSCSEQGVSPSIFLSPPLISRSSFPGPLQKGLWRRLQIAPSPAGTVTPTERRFN